MKTATLLSSRISPTGADMRMYQLSEPMVWNHWEDDEEAEEKTEYVIVSAVMAFGLSPETYIFPAHPDKGVTSYGELEGSFKGGLDHAAALRDAGYEIVEEAPDA